MRTREEQVRRLRDRPIDPLAEAIARAVEEARGSEASPVGISRRPSPYRSTLPLYDVKVELADGELLQLTLKHLDPGHPDLVRLRPRFLRRPEREAAAYRVLDGHSLGVPFHYGSWPDHGRGMWLLIERVDGSPLWQAAGLGPWVRVAAWLGGFHAGFSGPALPGEPDVRVIDREHLERWPARALELAAWPDGERVERIVNRVHGLEPDLPTRILGLPASFIHGEFYPANILVQRDPVPRVCPVDWEMAAIGSGLLDLAALVTGWPAEEVRTLVDAYHVAWIQGGGPSEPDRAELLQGLLACRLQLAVQWLGWSADWTPPPEQARDWAAEAEALLEELER